MIYLVHYERYFAENQIGPYGNKTRGKLLIFTQSSMQEYNWLFSKYVKTGN